MVRHIDECMLCGVWMDSHRNLKYCCVFPFRSQKYCISMARERWHLIVLLVDNANSSGVINVNGSWRFWMAEFKEGESEDLGLLSIEEECT
jgi:hypothetical protein